MAWDVLFIIGQNTLDEGVIIDQAVLAGLIR
jgi:hypothetical protein